MTPEEQHRLVQSVVAYGIVVDCAEGFGEITLTADFCRCLLRLIDDAEYREVAKNTWQEWASGSDDGSGRGKILRTIREMEEWQRHNAHQSATHTADTQRISKT